MSEDVVLAAGAVLWRPAADGDIEVAVVHRPRYDDWSLPKGKVDPGEHLLETTVRELREETGMHVHLGRPLGVASYIALRRPKRVHYWAARPHAGEFTPTEEVDALEWHPVDSARERVHRESDRAVLSEFARVCVDTAPIVILRHAKALSRRSWGSADHRRPLSGEGHGQAQRLTRLLGAWAPERFLSSPSERCVQTLEPTHRETETVAGLSEEGFEQAPTEAPDLLEGLVHDARPAVLCTHRPVLPALVERARTLAEASGAPVDLRLDASPLKPAEMLVLHVAKGQVLGAERHRV